MTPHHGHTSGNTFFDMWNPDVLLFTVLIAVIYLAFTGPWQARITGSEPVSGKKKVAFLSGLLLFYLAQGSPINYYGHQYLFSLHMVQQSFLYLVVPPLLLVGTPAWLLARIFPAGWPRKLLSFFTNPLIGALSFNLLFSFYHLPFIFDEISLLPTAMSIYHAVLLVAAFMMWWPIVSPLSQETQLSDLRKIAYIFANSVLITPACALIIFSDTQLYESYRQVPELIAGHSAFEDQRLGGVLMKLIQEGLYSSILAYTFFKWYKKERENDEVEFANILAAQANENKSRA